MKGWIHLMLKIPRSRLILQESSRNSMNQESSRNSMKSREVQTGRVLLNSLRMVTCSRHCKSWTSHTLHMLCCKWNDSFYTVLQLPCLDVRHFMLLNQFNGFLAHFLAAHESSRQYLEEQNMSMQSMMGILNPKTRFQLLSFHPDGHKLEYPSLTIALISSQPLQMLILPSLVNTSRMLSFDLLGILWWHNIDGQRWSGVKIRLGVHQVWNSTVTD